jgi:hypothetical protein
VAGQEPVSEPHHVPDQDLIAHLVQRITRWNLAQPALLLLDIGRPFSFIASQGLLLSEPILGLMVGEQRLEEVAALLADRSNVERLIYLLEQDRSTGGVAAKEKSW